MKRRVLFPHCPASFTEAWSTEENKSLVEFVLLHGDPHVWPSHSRTSNFWKRASDFVKQRSKSIVQRSGLYYTIIIFTCYHLIIYLFLHIAEACRLRVILKYPKKYKSTEAAERHFCEQESVTESVLNQVNVPPDFPHAKLIELVMSLPEEDRLKAISELFCYFAEAKYSVHIPSDFLRLTISASEHLLMCGRSNVVYGLAKAIGTERADKSNSRLPAKRMPMGLLEHMVNFYNADSYTKVKFSFIA